MKSVLVAAVLAASLLIVPSADAAVTANDSYGITAVEKGKKTVGFKSVVRLQRIENCSGRIKVKAALPGGGSKTWTGRITDHQIFCGAIIPGSVPAKYFKQKLRFSFSHGSGGTFRKFSATRSFSLRQAPGSTSGGVTPGIWNMFVLDQQSEHVIESMTFTVNADGSVTGSSFQFTPWTLTLNCGPSHPKVPVSFAISGTAEMRTRVGETEFFSSSVTPRLRWIVSWNFDPPFDAQHGMGGLIADGFIEIGGSLWSCSYDHPTGLSTAF